MTALEMQYNFQQKFYNMDMDRSLGSFQSHDIDNFLNESQLNLINELSEVFETSDKARTYLYAITSTWLYTVPEASSVYTVFPNGTAIELPSNFFRCMQEEATNSSGVRVKVKPQRFDYYNANINNPFKEPYSKLFWRVDVGKSTSGNKIHEIITDGEAIRTYHMVYLMNPTDISINDQVDCELHVTTHPIIVDGAVNLALQSLQRAGLIEANNK